MIQTISLALKTITKVFSKATENSYRELRDCRHVDRRLTLGLRKR